MLKEALVKKRHQIHMQTLLITLKGPQKQVDLQVPAEVPVGDLLAPLVALCVPSTTHVQGPNWQLVYAQRQLATECSLVEAGVVDGALLTLQDVSTQMTRPMEPVAAKPQHFVPRTVTPSRSTGGIGVTWSNDGLANDT